jgi:5-methylcytosine-specific restriction protein A
MPSRPKRPCSHPNCPELTNGQYCPTHAKAEAKRYDKYDRDPEHNKRYGRAWKKIREAYLRSHPLCELCREGGRLVPATTVHHKQKLTEGGTHAHSNLQSMCESCHSRYHAEQGDRWRR